MQFPTSFFDAAVPEYGVSRSAARCWVRQVRERITTIFHAHKGRYGYRRSTLTLCNEGFEVNHKTVERIMRETGIKSEVRKIK